MITLIPRFFALLCLGIVLTAFGAEESGIPAKSAVPDEDTAVAIAIAAFTPIYGAEKIEKQKPFHAKLSGDIWHVYGTLPLSWIGGTAEARISQKDGHIIKIWHSR